MQVHLICLVPGNLKVCTYTNFVLCHTAIKYIYAIDTYIGSNMFEIITLNAQVTSIYLRAKAINTNAYSWLDYNNSSPILQIKEYYSHTYKSMVGVKFVLFNRHIYICHILKDKPIGFLN